MIIEGLLVSDHSRLVELPLMKAKQTFVCGVASYFGLPNSLETAPFLTEEERKFARERIRLDSPSAQGYASLHITCSWTEH
jgi:hypothetical protein